MIHVILQMYESVQIFTKIPKVKNFYDHIHQSINDHQPIYHLNKWAKKSCEGKTKTFATRQQLLYSPSEKLPLYFILWSS